MAVPAVIDTFGWRRPCGTAIEDAIVIPRHAQRSLRGLYLKWRGLSERRQLQRRVVRALEMAPRGAIAREGPRPRKMSLTLELEWYARDIHPWDRDLPPERRAALFAADAMRDTVAAIRQVFERLTEVDVIQIRVLAPNQPDKTVLLGTVCRDDLDVAATCPSPAMTLKLLGVQLHLVDECC